jgi:DNA-binding GntR family transcriptional regulator
MARTKATATAPSGAPAPLDLNLRTYKRAVYETLRDMIVAFDLEPGDRLVETELAARLGVSKTPVREALAMLESDGLVDVAPYRGATVRWLSVNQMREQGFLVDALEMPAYPLVIERITDDELTAISSVVDQLKRARRDKNEKRFAELAVEVHSRLFAATGYPRLQELIRLVLGPVGLRYDKALVYADRESWDTLLAVSVARFEAIRDRDVDKVIRIVREYRVKLLELGLALSQNPAVARYFRED